MRHLIARAGMRRSLILATAALAGIVGGCTGSSAAPAASSANAGAGPTAGASATPSPSAAPLATARPAPTVPPALLGVLHPGGAGWAMTKVGDALFIQVDPPVDAIVRVDTETGAATPFVKGGWKVVSGPEGLWVLCCDWLVKVDPDTGKELLRIEKGGSVALGDGAVWLLDQVGLHRIDPKKGTVGDPIGPGGALCAVDKGMAIAFGSAWLACKEGGVARLDIQTGKFVEIETPEGSHTLAVTDDAMWVTNYKSSSVSRIDPATNTATTIEGIGSGIGITAGGGFVWVSDPTGIAQLDPATGAIVGHIDLGPGLYYELVWDDGTIWASTRSDKIVKIDASQVSPPADDSGG